MGLLQVAKAPRLLLLQTQKMLHHHVGRSPFHDPRRDLRKDRHQKIRRSRHLKRLQLDSRILLPKRSALDPEFIQFLGQASPDTRDLRGPKKINSTYRGSRVYAQYLLWASKSKHSTCIGSTHGPYVVPKTYTTYLLWLFRT